MASIFDLLRDTMPIAAAEHVARWPNKTFDDLEIADMWPRMRCLLPGESYEAKPPAIQHPEILTDTIADTSACQSERLWGWKHDESDPATVTNVTCRVRHASYLSFVVADQIQFGCEDLSSGDFSKVVRITTMAGDLVELPLTKEFVDSRYVVFAGHLAEEGHPLWPLEAHLDKGLVIAFAYELDSSNQPKRWRDVPPRTEEETADLADADEAAKQLSGFHLNAPSVPSSSSDGAVAASSGDGAPPIAGEAIRDSWGARIRRGEFMPNTSDGHVVAGDIPSNPSASVGPVRVLVVLSFATFCERNDFDPGGLGAVAKLHPHIMVRSNVAIRQIERRRQRGAGDYGQKEDAGTGRRRAHRAGRSDLDHQRRIAFDGRGQRLGVGRWGSTIAHRGGRHAARRRRPVRGRRRLPTHRDRRSEPDEQRDPNRER